MNITEDEVIDIMFNGSKDDIGQFLARYDVAYSFSNEYKQYVIILRSVEPQWTIKGYLSLQIPNCVRFYGDRLNM